jgi:hypothetical protein
MLLRHCCDTGACTGKDVSFPDFPGIPDFLKFERKKIREKIPEKKN